MLIGQWSFSQDLLQRPLDFHAAEISLKDAMLQLSLQTEIPLSAPSDLFSDQKITIHAQAQPLQAILEELIGKQPIAYKLEEGELVFFKKRLPKKEFIISGYIREENTGEPLPLATIYDSSSRRGVTSNEFGYYTLTLPSGPAQLEYSYTGHQMTEKRVYLRKNTKLDITLDPSIMLDPILVVPENDRRLLMDGTSNLLSAGQIQQFPSLGGEVDALRAISSFAGVSAGSDGFGGIHIRGGSADQNLYLLDGVPVYNPLHTGGLYSIFDDQVIKNIQVYKGTAPARYGGRLSSVIDVKMKEGNHEQLTGRVSLGLTTAKGNLTGPLQKGKGSFITSFRHSLFHTYLTPISKIAKERKGDTGHTQHHFSDFYTKLNLSAGPKDQFYLSIYKGGDHFEDENESKQQSILPQTIFKDELFLNVTLTNSKFHFHSTESYQEETTQLIQEETTLPLDDFWYSIYRSNIQDKAAKMDFSYLPSQRHALYFGASVTDHLFQPGAITLDQTSNLSIPQLSHPDTVASISNTIRSQEYNLYAEDHLFIKDKTKVNLGLRTTLLAVQGARYWSFQPRFSLQTQLSKQLLLHIDAGKTIQNVHQLTTSGFGLPSDLWVSATANIPPQTTWQGSMGIEQSFLKKYIFGVAVYQKYLNHLIAYEEGANFLNRSIVLNAADWESRVTTGKGNSYGIETHLKKEIGRLTGEINYTWSKSTRQFAALNGGQAFDFKFDRPHNFNIAAAYQLSPTLQLNLNWTFQSGAPTTLPTSSYTFHSSNLFSPITVLNIGQRNSFRLPTYHRLDLECTFLWGKYKGQQMLKIGVYNAYNRKNPLFYRLREKEDGSGREFTQVSLLPILPSFSYAYQF